MTDAIDHPLQDELQEAPCARCRRPTRADALVLWTTRERVRTLARTHGPAPGLQLPVRRAELRDRERDKPGEPASERGGAALRERPPAFRYDTVTRADAVCPACHGRLVRGGALDGPERLRMWLTLAVFLALAVVLVFGVPTLMPNLLAAFWRNGAGGR